MSKLEKPLIDAANEALKWCRIYTTFVCFADPVEKYQAGIYNSATCTFHDTGSAKFGVTNYHVINGYREKRKEIPDLVFQVGCYRVDIDKYIISEDENLDLATFALPDEVWKALEKEGKQYCFSSKWPPDRIIQGETIFYLGFPGIFRERFTKTEYNFYMVALCEVVDSVSERQFGVAIDRDTWVQQFGIKCISELTDYGGFSGACIFRLPDRQITSLEPVGILFEAGDTMELHFVRHIEFIDSTGKILKNTEQ